MVWVCRSVWQQSMMVWTMNFRFQVFKNYFDGIISSASQVWAYKSNGFRLVLTLLAILCTGILPLGLALYWYRHWWVMVSKQQCTLEEAETVIVIDHYKVRHSTTSQIIFVSIQQ